MTLQIHNGSTVRPNHPYPTHTPSIIADDSTRLRFIYVMDTIA